MNSTSTSGWHPRTLFVFYFCYATCAALIFQKFLVPLMPSLHAGHGLLIGDSEYFHRIALNVVVNEIREHGWSAWRVYPSASSGLNAALLGALYAIFGVDPSLMIPINAFLHALAGVLIVLIARIVWPGKAGEYAGLIAGSLFVAFPSALNWYGQVHKDGFAIAGTFLMLHAWLRVSRSEARRDTGRAIAEYLAGALLLLSVRPYQLLIVVTGLAAALVLFSFSRQEREKAQLRLLPKAFMLLLLVPLLWSPPQAQQDSSTACQIGADCSMGAASSATEFHWKTSELSRYLPPQIDRMAASMARLRADFIDWGKLAGAESSINAGVSPASLTEVIAYLPSAIESGSIRAVSLHMVPKAVVPAIRGNCGNGDLVPDVAGCAARAALPQIERHWHFVACRPDRARHLWFYRAERRNAPPRSLPVSFLAHADRGRRLVRARPATLDTNVAGFTSCNSRDRCGLYLA